MRARQTRSIRSIALLAALIHFGALEAKEPNPLVRKWNERLQEAVQLLQAGTPQPAYAITDKLLTEMEQKVVPGDGSGKAFAMGLTLKALAEAGLGREREAAWHWQVAQQLEPTMESWDLTSFGEPAQVLARHRLSVDPQPEAMEVDSSNPEIGRPVLRERAYDKKRPGAAKKMPTPSETSRERWGEDGLELVAIIGADGRATHPRFVRQPFDLALAVSGADWLLDAEFDPATRGGVPTACVYKWRLNFRSELRIQ